MALAGSRIRRRLSIPAQEPVTLTPEDEGARRELKQALLEQFDLRSTQLVEERRKLLERLLFLAWLSQPI